MTNIERIQTSCPEALAAFLHNVEVRTLVCGMTVSPIDTEADLIEWLQEEEEELEEGADNG